MQRYLSFNQAMKEKFGKKVYKLCLDAGMTCPNRDGTLGKRGCIFCDGGSGAFSVQRQESLDKQIALAKQRVKQKLTADTSFIAYFQSYTNTYASIEHLQKIFFPIISRNDICAISIATRPDCLPDEVLSLLSRLNAIKPVFVELGLQTIHDQTAHYIRRAYPLCVFDTAVKQLKDLGISTVVHMILGLPGETRQMICRTAQYIAASGADGIKLQLLHVLRGTDLASDYMAGKFSVLEMEQYIHLLEDCIRILPPHMVIHRLTGDGQKSKLIAPLWSTNKKKVLNQIHLFFEKDNIIQGQWFIL